ncbi:MAG: Rieske 2Fe-2S domain-containing protein [Myxococcales bacterium]|nr:Rieske 2Fe-2S domain-containing protein [Myxococcales bacterium]
MTRAVARLPLVELRAKGLCRVEYPPYDVCVALVEGQPFAIEDGCNHAGASLSEGHQDGETITCPMHGYVFSLKTGELLAPLGLCGDQRRFACRVEGDEVVIEDTFELEVR